MATDILISVLGESVTKGTITTWLKSVDDTVDVDEPIVEVFTDKVDSEVPSPVAGVLPQIVVPKDETVEIGAVIARTGDTPETPAPATPEAAPAVPETPAAPAPAAPAVPTPIPAPVVPADSVEGIEVLMLALGESVTEGTVTAWLRAAGDPTETDEPLLKVSTDKVDPEVPSPASGLPTETRVDENETAEVGTVVIIISTSAPPTVAPAVVAALTPALVVPVSVAPAPAAPTPAPVVPASAIPAAPASAPAAPVAPALAPVALTPTIPAPAAPASQGLSVATTGGYLAPIVHKLTREAGIDLSTVIGTGVGGRVRHEDVEVTVKAHEAAKVSLVQPAVAPLIPAHSARLREPSPLRGTSEKANRSRQTIVRRMTESLQTAAQLTIVTEVDVTEVAVLHARPKNVSLATHSTEPTFLPFFIKAAVEALQYHPKINARIDEKKVTHLDHENIGIAVDTPRGLLAPAIANIGVKDIPDLVTLINDLAAHTRDLKIGPGELSDSTFTITNTGSVGALSDTPVFSVPETTITGVGAIVKRPMAVKTAGGSRSIAIHSMVYVSLSYDHRLVDGVDASRYLMDVKKYLEEGDLEADLSL